MYFVGRVITCMCISRWQVKPVDLGNTVLDQMDKRSLCEVMESPTGQRKVILDKLVQQSAQLLFEDNQAAKIAVVR